MTYGSLQFECVAANLLVIHVNIGVDAHAILTWHFHQTERFLYAWVWHGNTIYSRNGVRNGCFLARRLRLHL